MYQPWLVDDIQTQAVPKDGASGKHDNNHQTPGQQRTKKDDQRRWGRQEKGIMGLILPPCSCEGSGKYLDVQIALPLPGAHHLLRAILSFQPEEYRALYLTYRRNYGSVWMSRMTLEVGYGWYDLGYRLWASMTSVMVRLCTSQSRRQILPIEDQGIPVSAGHTIGF